MGGQLDIDTIETCWLEKLVQGSFTYVNADGRLRKARPIKNFQQDMALNGQLWEIAEQFVAA